MAFRVPKLNLCYLDAPKCGSSTIKAYLRSLDAQSGSDGSHTHDYPMRWDYTEIFTVLRDPCTWIASFWAHRVRYGWRKYPYCVPLRTMFEITQQYKELTFNEFVIRLEDDYPGIVGWFFGMYTVPGVRVFASIKSLGFTRYMLSLGANLETKPQNIGRNVPAISPEVRALIAEKESETFDYLRSLPDDPSEP